jgi:hypothetical protein
MPELSSGFVRLLIPFRQNQAGLVISTRDARVIRYSFGCGVEKENIRIED